MFLSLTFMKWNDISFIISSKYRKIVLESVKTHKTPTGISKELKIQRAHVSRALIELGKEKLVECLTPNKRKGRLYIITHKGREILKNL